MALTNQRFVTTWASEDAIDWRLYIIPSSVNYLGPTVSANVTLPSEFLLRDMELDTELGTIPSGLVSQTLKINVNIASLQGTAVLNDLRTDLLQGTTAKKRPINSDGTNWQGNQYAPLLPEDVEFDCFNTFVLQYNDGTGWKVAFIGCQKYSADNEIEITPLANVVKYTIELYDIQRCIGEVITPKVWHSALMCTDEVVQYSANYTASERTERRIIRTAFVDNISEGNIFTSDVIGNEFTMYISTFASLKTKISEMYSKYMRAITGKLTTSFVCHDIFSTTTVFYDYSINTINASNLAFISEIYDKDKNLVSGALGDAKMFKQFTNFYEVYKMLCENSQELVTMSYTFISGSPDTYTVTMSASNPYPALQSPSITFNQDTTYGNFKIKMLSEVLNQVNVNVTSISGERDTKTFPSGKQGTSGDNSKDVKIMFHNAPLITNMNSIGERYTVNPGYVLYYNENNQLFNVVYPILSIYFGAEYYSNLITASGSNLLSRLLFWQQNYCLPQTMADALVYFLGRKKQAEATVTTVFSIARATDVGKRCAVDFNNYNPLLQQIYNDDTALAVMTKHTHKVYEGMADVVLRVDAENA